MTIWQKEKFKHIIGHEWDGKSNKEFFGFWKRNIETPFSCAYKYVPDTEKLHICITHRMTSDDSYIIDKDGGYLKHLDSELDIDDIEPQELYITSDGKMFTSMDEAYKHRSNIKQNGC